VCRFRVCRCCEITGVSILVWKNVKKLFRTTKRRIWRLNNRFEKEIGEHTAEKRGVVGIYVK